MSDGKVVPMTPELHERWRRATEQTGSELPELLEMGRRMQEASAENTLSGHLRRSIHQSRRELAEIAAAAGISAGELNEFLTGDRTLRSDVLDRLASAVTFSPAQLQVTPAGTSIESANTIREAILECFRAHNGGPMRARDVNAWVLRRYPGKWADVTTDLADLTINGNSSSTYRESEKCLHRVSRGEYRLDPAFLAAQP